MADIEIINDKSLEFKDFFTSDIDNTYVYEIGWHIVILLFLPIVAIKRFWKENKFKKRIYFIFDFRFILFIYVNKIFPLGAFRKISRINTISMENASFCKFFLKHCLYNKCTNCNKKF